MAADYSGYVTSGLSGAQNAINSNYQQAYPTYTGGSKANPYAQQQSAAGMASSGYDPTKGVYGGIGRDANSIRQDYQGTAVTLKVAAQLAVPRISLCINKASPKLPEAALREKAEAAYGYPVEAVLYHADEMMELASDGLFALQFPDHALSRQLVELAGKVSA